MRLIAVIIVAIASVETFAQTSEGLPKYLVPDLPRTHRILNEPVGRELFAQNSNLKGITQIGLHRLGCQVRCPKYSLMIFQDGTFHYYGKGNVEHLGWHTATIGPLQFRKIADFIATSGWQSMDTEYRGGRMHGETNYYSVVMNGQLKVVEVAWDDDTTPELFVEIGRLIDESLINAQWSQPESSALIADEIAEGLAYAAPNVRWASAVELAHIGVRAHAAVAPLISRLDDSNDEVRIEVLRALAKIRWKVKDHARTIAALLEDDNPKIRSNAAAAIAASGSQDPTLLPLLIKALRDEDFNVHARAADALAIFGPDADEAVPLLMTDLKASLSRPTRFTPAVHELHSALRASVKSAVKALAKITPGAPELVSALAEILRETRPQGRGPHYVMGSGVQQAAILVLKDMGPQASGAVDAIVPHLSQDPGYTRQPAADCLGAIGPLAAPAIPALVDLVRGPGSYPTPYAMTAIRKILGDSDEAIQIMKELMSHSDKSTRMYALKELGAIGPQNPNVVPILLEGLSSDKEDVRRFSIRALGQVGGPAARVVPELKDMLKSTDLTLRTETAGALSLLAPSDPEVKETLIELLTTSLAFPAASSLRNIRPPPRDAIPALEAVLEHESIDARNSAARTLLNIDPASKKAQSFMVASLDDHNLPRYKQHEEDFRQLVRMWTLHSVAAALGENRLASADIVPALIAFAETDFYQAWIPEELAKYGELAAEALPLLEDMAEYADPETREAAAEAIRQIRTELAAPIER